MDNKFKTEMKQVMIKEEKKLWKKTEKKSIRLT